MSGATAEGGLMPAGDTWSEAIGLVFVGCRLSWKPSISDYERIAMPLGEKWESQFTEWGSGDRAIWLSTSEVGYAVRLGHGFAAFQLESAHAYERAADHFRELSMELDRVSHERRNILIEAQHLYPVPEEFDALLKRLESIVFNVSLHESVGELCDFAYLADFRSDGKTFQVSLGPVRAQEVRRRVDAKTLKHIPDVAIFCSVTGRRAAPQEQKELSAYLADVLHVGDLMRKRLVP